MTTTLFSVTTVARRGGLPHTERVFAATRAAAFSAAATAHRNAQDLPPTASITAVSVKPVSLTLPKPKLNF